MALDPADESPRRHVIPADSATAKPACAPRFVVAVVATHERGQSPEASRRFRGLPTYRIAYTGCTEQWPHQIALFTIT